MKFGDSCSTGAWREKVACCWRRVSGIVALAAGALALWGAAAAAVGPAALPPAGQLFMLAALYASAHVAGRLAVAASLPPLLGPLAAGLLMRNLGAVSLDGEYLRAAGVIRRMALAVILIRAGLGLDVATLRRHIGAVLRLAAVPSLTEACALSAAAHWLLGLPWAWGALIGAMMAAVSPAVVIPVLFRLQEQGYGCDKGIPTLVVAAASLDDVLAVTAFGVLHSVVFSTGYLWSNILQGLLGIVIGGAFGVAWGAFARVVPRKNDDNVAVLRTLMVGGGGLLAVLGSDAIGYDGAGPLGAILAALLACHAWRQQGWSDSYNPVAAHFGAVWAVFQTCLFALIGAEVQLTTLDPEAVALGVAVLVIALSCRIAVTVLVAWGPFTWKEKFFVSFAWFPKATVQAALGPVAMDSVRALGLGELETRYASHALMLAALAILLTAPAGAALLAVLGSRLLTRSQAASTGDNQTAAGSESNGLATGRADGAGLTLRPVSELRDPAQGEALKDNTAAESAVEHL